MKRNQAKELRELYQRFLSNAVDKAVRDPGATSEKELSNLRGLQALLEMEQQSRRRRSRYKWFVVWCGVLTLLVLAALNSFRVRSMTIRLDATVTGLGFSMAQTDVLTSRVGVSNIAVSGIDRVQMPGLSTLLPSDWSSIPSIQVTTNEQDKSSSVDMLSMRCRAGSRIWIACRPSVSSWHLWTNGLEGDLRLSMNGPVRIADGRVNAGLHLQYPRLMVLRLQSPTADVRFVPRGWPDDVFLPNIEVTGLSFKEITESSSLDKTFAREASTVKSGSIRLESIEGRTLALGARDEISASKAHGILRTLAITKDGIHLAFDGVVEGLSLGTGETKRSLMPTLLQRIVARSEMRNRWAILATVAGAAIALVRFWMDPL